MLARDLAAVVRALLELDVHRRRGVTAPTPARLGACRQVAQILQAELACASVANL